MRPIRIEEDYVPLTYAKPIPKETETKTSAYRLQKIIDKVQSGITRRRVILAVNGKVTLPDGQTIRLNRFTRAHIYEGQIQILVEYSPAGKFRFVTVEPTLNTTYKLYI